MSKQRISPEEGQQVLQQQTGKLVSKIAGYVGVRTMELGLRFGLLEEISNHAQGISAEALATRKSLDPFYVEVWCRSAYAHELLELGENRTYKLAPYMDRLLVDEDFPGYIGAIPTQIVQPEIFDLFAEKLPSGEQVWYDQLRPEYIQMISQTTRSFYTRLIPGGLSQVPGLSDKLSKRTRILELACGAGVGLARIAQTYPKSTVVGADGDNYSLEMAKNKLEQEQLQDRVYLMLSTLEELDVEWKYDVALINASMHECRDIDKVTNNVCNALIPGGYFVISDFPFPDSIEELRTVPAQVMCGVQFVEALIGDQLLSTRTYVDLLRKHNFHDVGAFELNPVHAVIYGQK